MIRDLPVRVKLTRLAAAGVARRADRGSSLVELAVVLPVLVLVLVGAADFGRVFYTAMALTSAARAGAAYGGQSQAKSAEIANTETTAETAAHPFSLTAHAEQLCSCGNNDSTAFTALGTCAATVCTASQHKMYYSKVTTTTPFSMIAHYGFQHTFTVTRTAIQRAE